MKTTSAIVLCAMVVLVQQLDFTLAGRYYYPRPRPTYPPYRPTHPPQPTYPPTSYYPVC